MVNIIVQVKTRLQRDKVGLLVDCRISQLLAVPQGDFSDEDMTEQRRALIEEKMQRAEMKRVSLLQEKVKKAQEEEAKVNFPTMKSDVTKCLPLTYAI